MDAIFTKLGCWLYRLPIKNKCLRYLFPFILPMLTQLVYGTFFIHIPVPEPFLLFYPAFFIAALLGGFYAGILSSIFIVVLVAYFYPVNVLDLADQVSMHLFGISTFITSIVIELRNQSSAKLREAKKKIEWFTAELVQVEEKERKRIAQELHDGIASQLVATKLHLEQKKYSRDHAIRMIQIVVRDIRRIMNNLRPMILDDLGLLPAMNWLTREFHEAHPHIAVNLSLFVEENEIPDNLKSVIFRITQEALANALKYSEASNITIKLVNHAKKLMLSIEDNGKGFALNIPTNRTSFGLTGMKERADLSGGRFVIQSVPNHGVHIQAEWQAA